MKKSKGYYEELERTWTEDNNRNAYLRPEYLEKLQQAISKEHEGEISITETSEGYYLVVRLPSVKGMYRAHIVTPYLGIVPFEFFLQSALRILEDSRTRFVEKMFL